MRGRFAHDLVVCYSYRLLVVIIKRGRLSPTESAVMYAAAAIGAFAA